ncbi:MAG TPA: septum formation initiator family protein [Candidatus Sulfotelmatobacter sp.]|jgi:cell division protein FtsB|nr:septum formation initiator family protein [Candidatus Sulfotelmatobacter sp.]
MHYKKIVFFAILVILILTINDLVHSIYTIWQKQDLILQAQKTIAAAIEENQKLKKQIAQVNQPQFIESEARNKLLFAKPNEGIVILPKNQINIHSTYLSKTVDTLPNWQKWWDLFFST